MSIIFTGRLKKLKKLVGHIEPDGEWRALDHGGSQYRSDEGVLLNYWEVSGKLYFQGKEPATDVLKRKFLGRAQRKGFLIRDDQKVSDDAASLLKMEMAELRKKNRRLERRVTALEERE